MLNQVSMVRWRGKMAMNSRDWDGRVLVDKSRANDRDVGKQMKKDTWLLNGIVPTPLFILVRFFHNSLNLHRMQSYDLGESKYLWVTWGPSCFML